MRDYDHAEWRKFAVVFSEECPFFCDEDFRIYLELMAEWCGAHHVEIWAYCLIPNHVHLIAVPHSADGLRRAIGEVHHRYARMVNFRERWRGHL
jgi:putative transposase